ncbi:MAG: glutamate synthase subunit beta, partial [Vicinamibacterales bacterium]|nr:glutamate synthase subunit beta [Vicinamibacterales bacterium]
MGKLKGFIEIDRQKPPSRPVEERLQDWREVYLPYAEQDLRAQGARCMDCGIPFCHDGCPLGNLIPDWNDLVYRDKWHPAINRLHKTNNFPEWTGRLCPAPCEGSCVLAIDRDAVAIKSVELGIVERAFEEGWIRAEPPETRTGKSVAVIGSGPAGLAAADQLNRAGHNVTVFERSDRIGGLLRYGIPEFKMEKRFLNRRLEILEAEGITFQVNADIGVTIPADRVRNDFDAVLLAGGAGLPRDLPVPGRELRGVHFAMELLALQNRRCEGDAIDDADFISAAGKRVVIIGGGDTGADCLGTVHRQGATSVHQFELMPRPPEFRGEANPWPLWPQIFRVTSAHEEGGDRVYSVATERFTGDESGRVTTLHASKVEMTLDSGRPSFTPVPDSQFELDVDLVFLAMGFTGPKREGLLDQLGVALTNRGNVSRDKTWMTSVDGVFTAGDMQRGQSLIVWAIAEGRSAA